MGHQLQLGCFGKHLPWHELSTDIDSHPDHGASMVELQPTSVPCCHVANQLECTCTMCAVSEKPEVCQRSPLCHWAVAVCCVVVFPGPLFNGSGYFYPCLRKEPNHIYAAAGGRRPLAYFRGRVYWVPCVKWVTLGGHAVFISSIHALYFLCNCLSIGCSKRYCLVL